jgi:hypothetical protein
MSSTARAAAAAKGFRRKLAWVIGLSIVLAALVARWILMLPASADAAESGAAGEGSPEFPTSITRTRYSRVVVDWPVVVERDPFRSDRVVPPSHAGNAKADASALAEEARQTLRFTGSILGDQPKAIVNGKLYRKGDLVGGFRIQQIDKTQIVVERDGVSVRLTSD